MEMQDISTEGERKEEDEGASEPVLEVKTEVLEEEKPHHYAKLCSPSENIYAEAFPGRTRVNTEEGKKTEGNLRLYRIACVFLTIICLVLLLVVILLSVKPQTGSTLCPEREETIAATRQSATTCSYSRCQALFPNVQLQYMGCRQCADDWLTFGRSCFYLSTFRLSWDESQRNCSSRGGALAIISSPETQTFLTMKGQLNYWIGLRQKGSTWSWVNNTVLRESYWATDVASEGNCGLLGSERPAEKNWLKAPCQASSYFICQLGY
ncbi:early activation antigen CD69 isoform X1 [Labrus mixtus]|uniref:early activation antigen CD69 isoform X1 n=1 Tax=Labrus mixtus TaxID=508554 RepID=UPI0029C07310|nr:early activation antigen CD69 isoform X1 [Labrus mixtus]